MTINGFLMKQFQWAKHWIKKKKKPHSDSGLINNEPLSWFLAPPV